MNSPARYDESWREALDVYFPEVIAFFFPDLHALIDWQRPLDYLERWSELEVSTNPVAVIVMAHLKTKSTTGDPLGRKQWKWMLIRRLYEQGWGRQDIEQLLRILDWMMTLPPEIERQFREELDAYEEERKMPLITSMERLAKEEGLQAGIQQGLQAGIQAGSERTTREIALRMLSEGIELAIIARVTQLTLEDIQHLATDGKATLPEQPAKGNPKQE